MSARKRRGKSGSPADPPVPAEPVLPAEPLAGGDGEEAVPAIPEDELPVVEAEPVLDEAGEAGETAEEPSLALAPVGERHPVPVDPLTRYIQEVRRFAELDRDEERELARRFREEGDRDAAARLITSNLMLVVKLALMYRRAIRNVMDLIQEGNIGLMEALKRYDPSQGVRFSTYAAWWIKAYMLKYLLDNARLVRVGTTNARRKLLYNLRREQRKLEAQGIRPTPKLLAERFGVSEEDVVEVDKALSARDVSVDQPLSDDSRSTIADVLPADTPSVEDEVAEQEIKERVRKVLDEFRETLSERDRAILDQRLVAEDPATLQELGNRFGVTREAMRQAEAKLKKRLAAFLRERLDADVILRFTGRSPGEADR